MIYTKVDPKTSEFIQNFLFSKGGMWCNWTKTVIATNSLCLILNEKTPKNTLSHASMQSYCDYMKYREVPLSEFIAAIETISQEYLLNEKKVVFKEGEIEFEGQKISHEQMKQVNDVLSKKLKLGTYEVEFTLKVGCQTIIQKDALALYQEVLKRT